MPKGKGMCQRRLNLEQQWLRKSHGVNCRRGAGTACAETWKDVQGGCWPSRWGREEDVWRRGVRASGEPGRDLLQGACDLAEEFGLCPELLGCFENFGPEPILSTIIKHTRLSLCKNNIFMCNV